LRLRTINYQENKVKEFAERYWKIKQAEKCGACSTHIGDNRRIKIDQDTVKEISYSAILK
jgi:hypothetical protein